MAKKIQFDLAEATNSVIRWNAEVEKATLNLVDAALAAENATKSFRSITGNNSFTRFTQEATAANDNLTSSFKALNTAQSENQKAVSNLANQVKQATINWRNEAGSINENIKQNEKYRAELKQVQAELKSKLKATTDVHGNIRKVSNETAELRKRETELKQAISQNNQVINAQVKEYQAAEGSMDQMNQSLGQMRKLYRSLSDTQRNSDFGQNLKSQISELDTQIKGLDSTIGNHQRNVGDYKSAFSDAFSEFKSGNIQGGIDGTKTALNGLVASARAFIATPIGLAVTALAGIGLGAKAIWDYNTGLKESITLTEQFTGLTGASADAVRQQAQALTDTFGGEFKENLNAAQKLVEAFGISYDEAFDQITKGLANGGMANNEFYDSINEYPQLFKNAGYSAEEFIDLVNVGFQEGLFSDKLVDGIKEADLALKEQSKTTRDALVNAFGDVWTDDLLKRIKSGETTTKNALTEMAAKAQEAGLNNQQLGQLTADVFKGAGEDAGGAAKYFDIMNQSVGNLAKPLTETSGYFMELRDANVELQEAMDSALKSDSLISFQQQWDITWVKIQTGFFQIVKVVRDVYEWYDRVSGRSEHLGKIWNNLQRIGAAFQKAIENIRTTFTRLGQAFGMTEDDANGFLDIITYLTDPIKQLSLLIEAMAWGVEKASDIFVTATETAEAFGRTVGQILSLDFSKMKSLAENREAIKAENAELLKQNEIRQNQEKGLKNIIDLNNQMLAAAKAAKEAAEIRDEEEAKKKAEEAKKAAEEAAKKQAELQKKYAADQKKAAEDAKRNLNQRLKDELEMMKTDLDYFNLINKMKLDGENRFSDQIIEIQKKNLEEQFEQKQKIAEKEASNALTQALEKEASITIAEVKAKQERGEKLSLIEKQLLVHGLELNQWYVEQLQKIDDEVIKSKEIKSKEDLEREEKRLALDYAFKLANGEKKAEAERWYQDELNALRLESFEKLTGLSEDEVKLKYDEKQELSALEIQYLEFIAQMRADARTREQEEKDKEQELNYERINESLEFIGQSLGIEQDMRDAFEAYKRLQKALDVKDTEASEIAKLEIVAAVASAAASILGQYTVFGKAAAMISALINTALAIINALTIQPAWVGIAMSVAVAAMGAAQMAKIASAQPPQPPQFNASFATGVTESQFEGAALVDEVGAEIHLDKHGNIKSMGKDRPNIRQVKKGDTIIPAPISSKLKRIMDYTPFPDLMMSLDLNNLSGNDYDFSRLESRLDKVEAGITKAINKKPNKSYLDIGDYLIEVTERNGSTHQRFISKAGINKPYQNNIQL